jgi:hypothetical protein
MSEIKPTAEDEADHFFSCHCGNAAAACLKRHPLTKVRVTVFLPGGYYADGIHFPAGVSECLVNGLTLRELEQASRHSAKTFLLSLGIDSESVLKIEIVA